MKSQEEPTTALVFVGLGIDLVDLYGHKSSGYCGIWYGVSI